MKEAHEKKLNMKNMMNQKIYEIGALYHQAANMAGISDSELMVWSLLHDNSTEYTQHDLCEILGLPKQTVNTLISGYVKKNYAILEHVPGTRNRKVIRLTEEGIRYGEGKVRWIFDAEDRAIGDTTLEELEAGLKLLDKYIEMFRNELYTSEKNKG